MPTTSPSALTTAFAEDLDSWRPVDTGQDDLRRRYLDLLAHGDEAWRRHPRPEHLTASCFVFDASFSHVLLCFHGKGRFWVQLGGHIEDDDASVADAAFREVAEESGLEAITPVRRAPADLNIHSLGSGFTRCTAHWDVGFAAVASRDAEILVSEESDDVAWWPVDALPDGLADQFDQRLATVLAELGRG